MIRSVMVVYLPIVFSSATHWTTIPHVLPKDGDSRFLSCERVRPILMAAPYDVHHMVKTEYDCYNSVSIARFFGGLATGRLIDQWWNAMSPTPGSKF